MKILYTLVFCLFALQFTQAQDPVFAQFMHAPLQTNPALTGAFDGSFRAHVNYRSQWSSILQSSAFNTMAMGVDYRLPFGKADIFAFGLTALKDQAGDGRFRQTRAGLSAAFHKALNVRPGGSQYLQAAAYLGYGQNSLDMGRLWLSDQVGTDNRPDLGSGSVDQLVQDESLGQVNFLDVSAGLMYVNVWDRRNSFYIGAAAFHLNEPVASLTDDPNVRLAPRWLVQAGGEWSLNDNLSLLPSAMATLQQQSWQALAGIQLRMLIDPKDDLGLRLGFQSRINQRVQANVEGTKLHHESLIARAGLEIDRWLLGLSYDLTTSALAQANDGRGAFEFSLIYTAPARQRRLKVLCPNF